VLFRSLSGSTVAQPVRSGFRVLLWRMSAPIPKRSLVDYQFAAGRSQHDLDRTGQQMVEVLEIGLTHYGW